ncbi:MAG: class I SAM-dependent methyltransferase [Bacteroidaceae bacterium]|nr:class I SAM-dependent methyltransferase [Bacteroidaceae bacterium]
MERITHYVCPLCGSSNIKKRFDCKDRFATGEVFEVCECEDCSFVFTQGIPDEKSIGRYYESPAYISHSDTSAGLVNKLYHAARSIMLRRKVALVKKLTMLREGKILDYGAGTGYFARAMKDAGWSVTAIEKSENARKYSMETFNFEMLSEENFTCLPQESFDVISMWHVMEHIQNLDAFWMQLSLLLDESGVLIVAVPNIKSYDAEYYREHWAAYDVPRHLWHFSPGTMQRLGKKHGFILERQRTMPFDGFYISMLSERYKGSRFPFIKGLWNGFVGWVASCDKRNASSSIIYVFRKKR